MRIATLRAGGRLASFILAGIAWLIVPQCADLAWGVPWLGSGNRIVSELGFIGFVLAQYWVLYALFIRILSGLKVWMREGDPIRAASCPAAPSRDSPSHVVFQYP